MQLTTSLPATPLPQTSVITTRELRRRPLRAPDYQSESHALGVLAETLAASPGAALQKLVDLAMQLCRGQSAGITRLEDVGGEPVLRWQVLAGRLAPHVGVALPREFSPCGTVLDRNALQLMERPVRAFPSMDALRPEIEEVLLIPFHHDRVALGTLWVVSHDPSRRFDAEDARLLTSLGKFAAAATEVLASLELLESSLARQAVAANVAATSDRNKERFMAILAHELRSPLAPIQNAAELLKHETLDTAARLQSTEIIGRQVRSMSRMIDDLLDVTRLRVGSLPLRRCETTVSEIIGGALETGRPLVEARAHALVVDVPREPIKVDGDVARLTQVMHNLIANAAKYTDRGGQIRISALRDGNEAVLCVSDTGIGIGTAQLESIFELYVQAGQAATERSAGGLGIGLYLARNIVEAHAGSIHALSDGPGRGSQFVVRLRCHLRRADDEEAGGRFPF